MSLLLLGCVALVAVVICVLCVIVGIEAYNDRKLVEEDLVRQILGAVSRATVQGKVTTDSAVAGSPLLQAHIAQHSLTAECNWPIEWPVAPESDLPLVRMLSGRFGIAECAAYRDGTFTLTHGYGANEGRPPADIVHYSIAATMCSGEHISCSGTITERDGATAPYVQKFSEIIGTLERKHRAQTNPA